MDPASIALIIQIVTAAIKAAPDAIGVIASARDWIASLFQSGAITKEQQDKLHAHLDAIMNAALKGEPQPHWQVEPDPTN